MNFQQLKAVQEAVRQEFNLTDTAEALFASQSAVSRQIRDLEQELGVDIFTRHGKRLTGLTPPGREIARIAECILKNHDTLKKVSDEYHSLKTGCLVVAATHAQVRYRLPGIVKSFTSIYPQVKLTLRQASPAQVIELLKSGDADIGFITEGLERPSSLVVFKAYSWTLRFIAPAGHPLLQIHAPSLRDIARFPIITFEEGMVGRERIAKAFRDEGAEPDIVISAVDSDVIKTYVELGLGIGIVAEKSFVPEVDRNIVCIKTNVVIPPISISVAVRRGTYLRHFAFAFIQTVIPELSFEFIQGQVEDADLEEPTLSQ